MRVHALTTGTVRITSRWRSNSGSAAQRLITSLADPQLTEPLPIWCYLIEHPEGLILVDTGILADANTPIWFPPYMRLLQRAAQFQISGPEQDIGHQVQALGFALADVRWVVLTHLHQDHDGGLGYFPGAEFLVSKEEWQAAAGLAGRMAGYQNERWPKHFTPTRITYNEPDPVFGARQTITQARDVYVVPTVGHSPGHMSLVLDEGDQVLFFAGDTSYGEAYLLRDAIDGVGASIENQRQTHRRILTLAEQRPLVYLPSHEWEAEKRLTERVATQSVSAT